MITNYFYNGMLKITDVMEKKMRNLLTIFESYSILPEFSLMIFKVEQFESTI